MPHVLPIRQWVFVFPIPTASGQPIIFANDLGVVGRKPIR